MEVVNPTPGYRQELPNATATLVLGILSIVPFCGNIGLILGIVGLILSKDSKRLYDANPDAYTGYSNLNAGRVLCIIGVVAGGLGFLTLILWILGIAAIFGTAAGLGAW